VCTTGGEGIWHTLGLDREFFSRLTRIDEEIARQVAAARCSWCGGPLYRSDYDRKPRGGLIAAAGEKHVRRISLCCGSEGCRHRATPPSVRFLGRRVYLGAAVVVASALVLTLVGAASAGGGHDLATRVGRFHG
jgi:hypothetical protein